MENEFKNSFKLFKNINYFNLEEFQKSNQFKEVIHVRSSNSALQKISLNTKLAKTEIKSKVYLGLKSIFTWNIFSFNFPKGLYLIENPFDEDGQKYWISRSVKNYPKMTEHITNIANLQLKKCSNKEQSFTDKDQCSFYENLRWVTFGYHHNWDTKVYTEESKCEFPKELAILSKYIANVMGLDEFEPEAAITNYYHLNSTLSGHQDTSERNLEAPLISISFGQSAIFLIGGETKKIKPIPVLLQSGDILIMTGDSRHSFHGVPKILQSKIDTPWLKKLHKNEFSGSCKRIRLVHEECSRFQATEEKCEEDVSNWDSFLEHYISKARVNINIRQVLFPGENKIPTST